MSKISPFSNTSMSPPLNGSMYPFCVQTLRRGERAGHEALEVSDGTFGLSRPIGRVRTVLWRGYCWQAGLRCFASGSITSASENERESIDETQWIGGADRNDGRLDCRDDCHLHRRAGNDPGLRQCLGRGGEVRLAKGEARAGRARRGGLGESLRIGRKA